MSKTNQEKPKILYHSSPVSGLKIIEPRSDSNRGLNEGNVVFGTPEVAYASMFLIKTDDSWTKLGRLNGIWYFICADEKRLIKSDKGGSIYSMRGADFCDPIGAKIEWLTKNPQVIIKEWAYQSGLEAMTKNRVTIHFVNKETFKKLTIESIKEFLDE